MPQSLAQLYIHLVFSTKGRAAVISDAVRSELSAYLAGILHNLGSPSLSIGIVADHAHILFRQSKNLALNEVVRKTKASSSKWIKTRQPGAFQWQNGYAAFSVSASRLAAAREYIENQSDHHRVVSFQDELRALLRKYNVEYDERYIWD